LVLQLTSLTKNFARLFFSFGYKIAGLINKATMQNLQEATNYLTSLLKSRDKNSEIEIRIRVSDEQLDKCIDVLHTRVNVPRFITCVFFKSIPTTQNTALCPQKLVISY